MDKRIISGIAGAALLAGGGTSVADEPLMLTDAQMDDVAAGGLFISIAEATAAAAAGAGIVSIAVTETLAVTGASGGAVAASASTALTVGCSRRCGRRVAMRR